MEIREYPTQDFHALNRATVDDELFDLVAWALIRKTFLRVELEVQARADDRRYPLKLRFYAVDGSPPDELLLHTVPESKMDHEAKGVVAFYANEPTPSLFAARLKEAYISIESEQIAWAELIQDERGKRWGSRILSLWHANAWSLVLSQAPHCTLLPAPLAHASGPAESLLIQGDSFLTVVAENKAVSPGSIPQQIIWQIVRELTKFTVIRHESLNRSHPSGALAATHTWPIAQETVVNLHRKHRSLTPSAIDELLGFFPVSDVWHDALNQIDDEPTFREGHWFVKGQVRDLTALLAVLPQSVELHEPYEPYGSALVTVVSFPVHRGLLTYRDNPQGGVNVWLAVYQTDERFEHAVARGDGSIASNWPPAGAIQ